MLNMKYTCLSEADMAIIAEYVVGLLSDTRFSGATVLALRGDLGAGKTTFMKFFAKRIGVQEEITSPTFVVQKHFDIVPFEIKNADGVAYSDLYHFDMYRIETKHELVPLRFSDVMADVQNIVCIEWPEKITEELPHHRIEIVFSHVDEKSREVVVSVI